MNLLARIVAQQRDISVGTRSRPSTLGALAAPGRLTRGPDAPLMKMTVTLEDRLVMRPPITYSHNEWAEWYRRVLIYPRTTPAIIRELRAKYKSDNQRTISRAEAELVKLDNDIVAGEFLSIYAGSPIGDSALSHIVNDMSQMAQDLLQALVEAKLADATP
jgi:hypothetical protein